MSGSPVVRAEQVSSADQRLFLVRKAGDTREADLELLVKAGVPTPEFGMVVHFLTVETEEMLARLERAYRDRPPEQIRRTTFLVKKSGRTFEFVVVGQQLR